MSLILVFIGIKMLLLNVFKIPTAVSLGVVVSILTLSIVALGPSHPSARL